jgi:hypothetical protein
MRNVYANFEPNRFSRFSLTKLESDSSVVKVTVFISHLLFCALKTGFVYSYLVDINECFKFHYSRSSNSQKTKSQKSRPGPQICHVNKLICPATLSSRVLTLLALLDVASEWFRGQIERSAVVSCAWNILLSNLRTWTRILVVLHSSYTQTSGRFTTSSVWVLFNSLSTRNITYTVNVVLVASPRTKFTQNYWV